MRLCERCANKAFCHACIARASKISLPTISFSHDPNKSDWGGGGKVNKLIRAMASNKRGGRGCDFTSINFLQ